MSFVKFYWGGIIVRSGDVIMVGNVGIDSAVASLWNEFVAVRVTLLVSPAICRLLYDGPAKIVVRQLAFLYWSTRRDGRQDSGEWQEHVVQVTSVIDRLALVCYL